MGFLLKLVWVFVCVGTKFLRTNSVDWKCYGFSQVMVITKTGSTVPIEASFHVIIWGNLYFFSATFEVRSSNVIEPCFYHFFVPVTSTSPSFPTEEYIPWQCNIQSIQNLMGTTWVTTSLLFSFLFLLTNTSTNSANVFALMKPYTYHLHLHPYDSCTQSW